MIQDYSELSSLWLIFSVSILFPTLDCFQGMKLSHIAETMSNYRALIIKCQNIFTLYYFNELHCTYMFAFMSTIYTYTIYVCICLNIHVSHSFFMLKRNLSENTKNMCSCVADKFSSLPVVAVPKLSLKVVVIECEVQKYAFSIALYI